MRLSRLVPAVLALSLALPRLVHSAVVVDGRLDPAYGPALVVQTTQASADSCCLPAVPYECTDSELDAAYAVLGGDTLHVFIAGNIYMQYNRSQPGQWADALALFIDTGAPGADTIRADAADPLLRELAGLRFDSGFHPSQAFLLVPHIMDLALQVDQDATPPDGPGTWAALGQSSLIGPSGTLSGGTNPFGIAAALDDSNTAGVSAGCGAASGLGVTTGAEISIPLAAIGSPSGCVRVSALLFAGESERIATGTVENQVLGPVPPGTCNLGLGSAVDFSAIPGDQFFTVCPEPAGVTPPAPPARLALSAPWPNPARGALRCSLALPHDSQVRCAIVDVAGRHVASVFSGALAAGTHTLDWSGHADDGARVRGGVYFVSATVDGQRLVRPVVVLGD